MKRSRARAQAFEKETERGSRTRAELDQRVRQEVAKDRIKGETVSEGSRSPKTLDEQSTASRRAARSQQEMNRVTEQAKRSEANLQRQRQSSTRQLLSQEQAVKRYGKYAGGRYIEKQADRYYDQNPIVAGAGGGARPPGGRPPAPPTPPGGGGPPKFTPDIAEERRQLAQLETQLASTTRQHQKLIQVQSAGGNVLRRHGALTTEYIQAAARGETTIRELGFQTSATIGKFGGWITAGAALYTALGAVQKMGAGAVAAYSGVNQLQRVINNVDASSARREFSSLADEFQLPVGQVTEGVYEIGKVFHDQNQALQASKALLYSVKVGELDTATAGRYLTAITNAYNLSAGDLNSTFDKFNQLQNNYSVAIAGTEAATSRAAGSFVNAGGSLDYLISLIGTASRVTGAAPERIGTAIQRAPSFIAKPKNQEILRQFGIEPEQSIEKTLNQAFDLAQNLSGKRRRELSAAIFGPQYGSSVGTPLLRQFDLFQKIQKSVAKSKGSGKRELETLKGSPEEQLANVGVQLERLGGNLADSGLLTLFGKLALSVDDVLRLTNTLAETFNDLPGPLRDALGLMVQLAVISRIAGRFNVGESIAPAGKDVGAARTFLGTAVGGGDRRDARLGRKGLYAEQVALEEERSQISQQARDAASRANLATEKAVQEQRRKLSLSQAEVPDAEAIEKSQARVTALRAEAAASTEQAVSLALDEETKAKRLNEVNSTLTKTKKSFGRLNVQGTLSALRERGTYSPTSFDVPTTKPPAVYGDKGFKTAASGIVVPGEALPFTKAEQQMRKVEQKSQATTRKNSRLRGAAGKMGNSFNRLLGSAGNLIFAAFTIGFVAEELKNIAADSSKGFEEASRQVDSAAAQAKQLKSLQSQANQGDSFSETVSDLLTGSGPFGGSLPEMLGLSDSQEGLGDIRRATANIHAAWIQDIKDLQNKTRSRGEPVPYRYVGDIDKEIGELQSGNKTTAQARRAVDRFREELAKSMEAEGLASGGHKKEQERLQAARAHLNQASVQAAAPKDVGAALKKLNPEELQKELEAQVTNAGLPGGLNQGRLQKAGAVYRELQRQLGTSTDPEAISALATARSAYFDGLGQDIQNTLDRSLLLSKDPADRTRAYAQAFDQLRAAFGGGEQSKEIEQGQRRLQKLRSQLDDASRDGGLLGGANIFGGLTEKIKNRTERLRQDFKEESAAVKGLEQGRKEARAKLEEARQELRVAQYEENAPIRQAHTELRVARTADPLRQSRIKLAAINVEIGKALDVYGRGSKEVLDLLQQRQEIIAQRTQDQVNLIEAKGSLASANLSGKGNEIPQARVELRTLQSKLAYEQAHSNRFDPAEIIQLQADIRSAQIQLAQTVEEQAEELALAAIDIKIARAEAGGNDVRAARLNVNRAKYTLGHADTPLEKRQARADLIGKRAGLRDAASQKAIEDVQFQADIGKLTLDQQIRAYQGILNTMKLTRDSRRDLRRRIYQLRQETENDATFDLNVGNIKLPTLYEIRRAVKGGVNGGGVVVNQQNTYTVHGGGDSEKVVREIARLHGGANKAAMRSAGLR